MAETKIGGERKSGNELKLSEESENTTKGTMFSVGVVGAVIFITYLIVFGLYMSRV
jgi:hypothetical protein